MNKIPMAKTSMLKDLDPWSRTSLLGAGGDGTTLPRSGGPYLEQIPPSLKKVGWIVNFVQVTIINVNKYTDKNLKRSVMKKNPMNWLEPAPSNQHSQSSYDQ